MGMKRWEVEELRKRKMGAHVSQRLDKEFSLLGGSLCFSLRYMLGQNVHSCLLSVGAAKLEWQWGWYGGTVAEIGGRKWGLAFRTCCAVFCGIMCAAQHAGPVRSET